jgi:2-hydroxychromene-2-carboxylate isomerase
MALDATIDFWFSVGSTCSYLSIMREPDQERTTGIGFRWRPFNVLQLMTEMNDQPNTVVTAAPSCRFTASMSPSTQISLMR